MCLGRVAYAMEKLRKQQRTGNVNFVTTKATLFKDQVPLALELPDVNL